jgi:hypothetical protein
MQHPFGTSLDSKPNARFSNDPGSWDDIRRTRIIWRNFEGRYLQTIHDEEDGIWTPDSYHHRRGRLPEGLWRTWPEASRSSVGITLFRASTYNPATDADSDGTDECISTLAQPPTVQPTQTTAGTEGGHDTETNGSSTPRACYRINDLFSEALSDDEEDFPHAEMYQAINQIANDSEASMKWIDAMNQA